VCVATADPASGFGTNWSEAVAKRGRSLSVEDLVL
jgi:hypothetical protein